MNKNIKLLLGALVIAFTLYNCKEEADPKPDINLVPVYSIVNINGKTNPTINIYKENPLVTVWEGNNIKALLASEYTDSTIVDSVFKVRVTSWEEVTATENFSEVAEYDIEGYEAEDYIKDTYLRKYVILAEDHMDTAVNVGEMDVMTTHTFYNRYIEMVDLGEGIENVENFLRDLGVVTDSIETEDGYIKVEYEMGVCQDTIITVTNETQTLELEEKEVFN